MLNEGDDRYEAVDDARQHTLVLRPRMCVANMCNVMRAYIYQVNVLLLNVCTQEDCPIINAGKKVDNTKLTQMAQLNVTVADNNGEGNIWFNVRPLLTCEARSVAAI